MSDYNNRIKEWITNLVIEELNEDDSWWTSMSADQQADYIKRHPQSQKAQDAKKEKEDGGKKGGSIEVTDSTKAQEIEDWYDNNKDKITDEADREELSDMIRGLSVTEYDLEVANNEGDPYDEAEYLQNQVEDYKDDIKGLISKYDKKPSDDKPAKPNKDDIEDINNGSALDSFINKYDFSDEEEDELYKIQSDMDKGYTSAQGAQAKITRLLGLEKELSYTPPQVKQKVAGAADAREVRNNVMKRLGRDRFNKLSYGELQQAYADEFERLGFKKVGKNYVKQESVVKSALRLEEVVGKSLTEEQFDEAAGKKDACYHKVKARYDVWPSAYASGALVKCRKVGAKNWGNKSKKEGTLKEFGLSPTDRVLKSTMKNPKTGKTVTVGSIMNQGTKKYPPALVKKARAMFKMAMDKETQIRKKLYGKKEGVNENIGKLIGVAVGIAKKMSGNMTGAVKKIEKISKGLSKLEPVQKALRKYNEGYPGKSLKPLHDDELDNEGFASDAQRRAAFASGYEEKGKKKKKKESVEEAYDIWMEDGSWGYTMTGIVEAEYQGRKVKLGKPMQGDVKKFKVYVKNPKGNVVKVNFGQGGDAKGGTMRIRKSNPKARANFRARHNCDNPGPRHKARYWSCKKW